MGAVIRVLRNKEWTRIDQLDRREPVSQQWPGLWDTQNTAIGLLLTEGSLIAEIPVGGGKTPLTYVAPRVLGLDAVLAVPANLIPKTKADFKVYDGINCFGGGGKIQIVSHSYLSRNTIPDCGLLMIDEAHLFANRKSGRGRRLIEWRRRNPDALMLILTGTLVSGSIGTMQFLSLLTLKRGSPLPLTWNDTESWAFALDANTQGRANPGPLVDWAEGPGFAAVRAGVLKRMGDTPGVYVSKVPSFDGPLAVDWIKGPDVCKDVRATLLDMWEDHTGRELFEATEVWARVRQAEVGLGYRREPEPPEEWHEAKRAWAQFVTSKTGSKYKTMGEVKAAFPEEFDKWDKVRRAHPFKDEYDWLDRSVYAWAWSWAERTGGVIWVTHARPEHDWTSFGAGAEGIRTYEGPCFASISAHGTGKHLVQWSEALVLNAPGKIDAWEQLIGRHHRFGQEREVRIKIFDTPANRKAVTKAIAEAKFSTGSRAKLLTLRR